MSRRTKRQEQERREKSMPTNNQWNNWGREERPGMVKLDKAIAWLTVSKRSRSSLDGKGTKPINTPEQQGNILRLVRVG